jgi:hypothetical protein
MFICETMELMESVYSVLGTKCMFNFFLQHLEKAVFTLINILWVTLEMHAEIRESVYVECPLLLSDFNQNWNKLINCSETHQYQISLKFFWWFLSCYMWIDRHCNLVDTFLQLSFQKHKRNSTMTVQETITFPSWSPECIIVQTLSVNCFEPQKVCNCNAEICQT